jgi:dihydroorotase
VLQLKGRGSLAVGSFADIVLFRPNDDWQFHVIESKSKSRNSPFDGSKLPGSIQMTISEGRVVYEAKNARSSPRL